MIIFICTNNDRSFIGLVSESLSSSNEQNKPVENYRKRKLEEVQKEIQEIKDKKQKQDLEIESLKEICKKQNSLLGSLKRELLDKESKEASVQKFVELEKRLVQQGEITTQRRDRYEESMDVQEELIAVVTRQLQITDNRVEQNGERLNVLEQRADNQNARADNQDQRIDELRPLAGMVLSVSDRSDIFASLQAL